MTIIGYDYVGTMNIFCDIEVGHFINWKFIADNSPFLALKFTKEEYLFSEAE